MKPPPSIALGEEARRLLAETTRVYFRARAAAMERDALLTLAEHHDVPMTALHPLIVEQYGARLMQTSWFVTQLPQLPEF